MRLPSGDQFGAAPLSAWGRRSRPVPSTFMIASPFVVAATIWRPSGEKSSPRQPGRKIASRAADANSIRGFIKSYSRRGSELILETVLDEGPNRFDAVGPANLLTLGH